MDTNSITERIIGSAFTVANKLGPGFLEKVYENALSIELQRADLRVIQQSPIEVYYEGHVVGEFIADLVVEDSIIVELKAIKALNDIHMAQCLNYLRATNRKTALLLNFGNPKIQVKRISL